MKHYNNDPRWITVKYANHCAKCGRRINKGENAFYYPLNKKLYCDSEKCGGAAARDFQACAFDEMQYNSQF